MYVYFIFVFCISRTHLPGNKLPAEMFTGYWQIQFSSVAQSCLTLCNPMNHSTPGLPVHQHLLEFTQSHVHRVGDAIQPSHPLSSPLRPAPNPSQHQSLFQWVNSRSLNFIQHNVTRVVMKNVLFNIIASYYIQCEVKWALESITMNKALGGDGIPVELFQILKDDAVKGCTPYASKFGKLSSGHRTGKGQFSFQSQKKEMQKSAQTTAQLHSSHTLV